jgi:hypothetical protein
VACFTREAVFSVYSSNICAPNNPHAICERGYQVCCSVRIWARIIGDIVVDRYQLLDRLTAQRCPDLLEAVLPGLIEDVHLAVKQTL